MFPWRRRNEPLSLVTPLALHHTLPHQPSSSLRRSHHLVRCGRVQRLAVRAMTAISTTTTASVSLATRSSLRRWSLPGANASTAATVWLSTTNTAWSAFFIRQPGPGRRPLRSAASCSFFHAGGCVIVYARRRPDGTTITPFLCPVLRVSLLVI